MYSDRDELSSISRCSMEQKVLSNEGLLMVRVVVSTWGIISWEDYWMKKVEPDVRSDLDCSFHCDDGFLCTFFQWGIWVFGDCVSGKLHACSDQPYVVQQLCWLLCERQCRTPITISEEHLVELRWSRMAPVGWYIAISGRCCSCCYSSNLWYYLGKVDQIWKQPADVGEEGYMRGMQS